MKTFSQRVVELALMIPSGRVTTYGRIARAAGGGGGQAARSVTAILGKAYEHGETRIPFHRIIYSDGRVWTNNEYNTARMKIYKQENIEIDTQGKVKYFDDLVFDFT